MENEKDTVVTEEVTENTTTEEVTEKQEPEKLFTQSELDELIERRIKRERKKIEKELNQSKIEETKEDNSEEITKLNDIIKKQNQRIIKNESLKIAKEMNVSDEFLNAVIELADFSEIEVDNNGDVDTDDVKDILQSVIDRFPSFLAKKTETKTEEVQGFIKSGVQQKEQTSESKLLEQIRKNMGLK